LSTFVINSLSLWKTFDILQTEKAIIDKSFSLMPTNRIDTYFCFSVVCRNDGTTIAIPQNVLGNLYFNSFKKKTSPIFSKVLKNMLNIRDHLLLQLDLECGNISEEYFDKEEAKYLTEPENIPFEKLKEEVEMLFTFTDLPLDSEDISEILNCSIEDAEKALKNNLMRLEHASA